MNKLAAPSSDRQSRSTVFTAHHERVRLMTTAVISVFFAPFAINNLVQGRYVFGVMVLLIVAAMGIDAVALYRKKPPPIPVWMLLLPVAAGVGVAIHFRGIFGVLWSYPAILFAYFVLSLRWAATFSLMLSTLVTVLTWSQFGWEFGARVAVSLSLCILFTSVTLNIIRNLQRELLEQTITDPLTGAFNRRHLDIIVKEAVERARRSGNPAAILALDIDHFKTVNDEFGHEAGDRVLAEFVSLIRKRSRMLDRLFRVGGEEFLLLLPDTSIEGAMIQAENLRVLIEHAKLIDDRPVTVSIGVAALPPECPWDAWLKMADVALYGAKQSGRNRVVDANRAAPPHQL